jgi:hypothetical protein
MVRMSVWRCGNCPEWHCLVQLPGDAVFMMFDHAKKEEVWRKGWAFIAEAFVDMKTVGEC